MEEFLYLIRPTRLGMLTESTPEEQRIVGEHFQWMSALAEQGILLLAGRTLLTDERTFGIAIVRAESYEAAQTLMSQDPAIVGGVMRHELYPYRVAILSQTYPRPQD
jgi:uncharacterized protein YciI